MKRTLEANLTLEEVAKYMAIHEAIVKDGGRTAWTIDKHHVINSHLCVVPKEKFVFRMNLKKEEYEEFHLWIDDKDCGTLTNPSVDKLTALAKKATFGKGTKEVYDPAVRTALAIDGSRIHFTSKHTSDIKSSEIFYQFTYYNNGFKDWCGASPSLTTLYKLHIYPKGGKFDTHVDTPHDDKHIASAIIILGSAFSGGALVIEHAGQEERVSSPGTLAAWYTDCPHRVEEVTGGTRIVLQFDVNTNAQLADSKKKEEGDDEDDDENESSNSNKSDEEPGEMHAYFGDDHVIESAEWKKRFLQDLKNELDSGFDVALLLEHTYYSVNQCPSPATLKGRDRLLWSILSNEGDTITTGLVAIVSDYQELQFNEGSTRSIGPLTSVPNQSKRPTIFIPGPNSNLFEVIDKPGAELQGNSPMEGSSTYLGIVIYCTIPWKE